MDRPDYYIDITGDTCPLTFVKTKLLLEKMPPGALATVRLKGAQPLDNVPRSVRAHGHDVISLAETLVLRPWSFFDQLRFSAASLL